MESYLLVVLLRRLYGSSLRKFASEGYSSIHTLSYSFSSGRLEDESNLGGGDCNRMECYILYTLYYVRRLCAVVMRNDFLLVPCQIQLGYLGG